MMQSIVERLLSSTGKTNGSMVVLLSGATTIKPAILQSETHLYHQSQEMQGLDEKKICELLVICDIIIFKRSKGNFR
ncbi:MAG: hypothetical protein IJ593_08565 [Lachnospiraceae bacterium]|nr:hypothetical protein [Lachnospiraceae bacterium]